MEHTRSRRRHCKSRGRCRKLKRRTVGCRSGRSTPRRSHIARCECNCTLGRRRSAPRSVDRSNCLGNRIRACFHPRKCRDRCTGSLCCRIPCTWAGNIACRRRMPPSWSKCRAPHTWSPRHNGYCSALHSNHHHYDKLFQYPSLITKRIEQLHKGPHQS